MLDGRATIPFMSTEQLRPIYRDPNVRHARDLPFTAAQAAAVARVLDEIRSRGKRHNASGRPRDAGRIRNRAGGVSVLTPPAPLSTVDRRNDMRRNSRFSEVSGTSVKGSAYD